MVFLRGESYLLNSGKRNQKALIMVRDFISWLAGGGKKKSAKDYIINLKVVSRRLERSRRKLERTERESESKLRRAIQKGDIESARMYAADISRSRKWARGYQSLISKIDGLIFKLERADAVQSIASEMAGVAAALKEVNISLRLPEIDNVVNDMESALNDIEDKSSIMEDSVEGLFALDTDQGEVDDILKEYGLEVGIAAETGLPTPATPSSSVVSELEKEIEDLKKED